jgi:transposase InsO family protein
MKQMNLVPVVIKRYKPKTSNGKVVMSKENILKQDFTATKPNEKWLTDITYIYTEMDGWIYLALIEDLFSRKIVGYHYSRNIDKDLVIVALNNAIIARGMKVKHLIIHSDLGSQYTSNDFENILKEYHIPHSYSAKGYPYDNSPMESFNSIIKKEEVYTTTYKDFQDAKLALFEYIEGYYNTVRIHSSIDYYTPNEFEDAYYNPHRYVNFVH